MIHKRQENQINQGLNQFNNYRRKIFCYAWDKNKLK